MVFGLCHCLVMIFYFLLSYCDVLFVCRKFRRVEHIRLDRDNNQIIMPVCYRIEAMGISIKLSNL